jgi:hypothetical protein
MGKKFHQELENGFVLRADAFTDAIQILTEKTGL